MEETRSNRWQWHLDKSHLKINGALHDCWRDVDLEGKVFENFVSKSQDKKWALIFAKAAGRKYRQL